METPLYLRLTTPAASTLQSTVLHTTADLVNCQWSAFSSLAPLLPPQSWSTLPRAGGLLCRHSADFSSSTFLHRSVEQIDFAPSQRAGKSASPPVKKYSSAQHCGPHLHPSCPPLHHLDLGSIPSLLLLPILPSCIGLTDRSLVFVFPIPPAPPPLLVPLCSDTSPLGPSSAASSVSLGPGRSSHSAPPSLGGLCRKWQTWRSHCRSRVSARHCRRVCSGRWVAAVCPYWAGPTQWTSAWSPMRAPYLDHPL